MVPYWTGFYTADQLKHIGYSGTLPRKGKLVYGSMSNGTPMSVERHTLNSTYGKPLYRIVMYREPATILLPSRPTK